MKILRQRKSPRLKGYDYSQNGAYFVTLCSVNRLPLFGEISDGVVQLSQLGTIAQNGLERITDYWTNVDIDHFVVMPNHVHTIILIAEAQPNDLNEQPVGAAFLPPASTTLSKVVGAYKAGVTRTARQESILDDDAIVWQRSYHDHIIQSEQSLDKLRHYIEVNPTQWDVDRLHPDKPQQ